MALVLGIPLTIATLTTLIKLLSSGGHVIHDTYGVTEQGISTIRSKPSKYLLDRCSIIAEILQGVDHNILITNLGRKIVQTLVDCMAWAHEYDKKYRIAKIIFSGGHRSRFKECHQAITQDLSDIAHTIIISSRLHNDDIYIEDKEILLNNNMVILSHSHNYDKEIPLDNGMIILSHSHNYDKDPPLDNNMIILSHSHNYESVHPTDNNIMLLSNTHNDEIQKFDLTKG